MAEGKGYTNIIGFEETPHTHFPPGYPLYLSLWHRLSPDNFLIVKKADGVLLYLSILLLFFLFKRITGGKVLVPFFACAVTAVQVDLLRFACMIMSEPLYLFCTLVILHLALRLAERDLWPTSARWYDYVLLVVLLFFIGYVSFVRSIGMSVILALLLWLAILLTQTGIRWLRAKNDAGQRQLLSPRIRHYGLLLVLSAMAFWIPKECWDARNAAIGITSFPYKSQYMKKENGGTMSTTQEWVERVVTNTTSHITCHIPKTVLFKPMELKPKPEANDWLVGMAVLLVMVAGLLQLKKGGWLLFFYLGATMGAVVLFPEQFSNERYFWAIIPFFFFLFLNGLTRLVDWLSRYALKKENSTAFQNALVAALALLLMMPRGIEAQSYNRKLASLKSWKQLGTAPLVDFIAAAEWCGKYLPDTARIACRKPETFYVNSNFHKALSFPYYAPTDTIISYFTRERVHYVIIDSWFRHAYYTVYPAILANQEKFSLVQQFGTANPQQGIYPTLLFAFNPQAGYTGEYQNGKRHGQGKMVLADGRMYVGQFENDLPNGYGEMFDAQGVCTHKGIWKDGQLIKME